MMKNKEISRIILMLQKTYDGAAWHGASVMEIIDPISARQAFHSSEHIHSISKLVYHMIAWRTFTIRRLEGDIHYEVSQQENWKENRDMDEQTWQLIKNRLKTTQEQLIKALENINDERLDDIVEGKAYDYYTLIHGVIHHDLYHLGEIALLAKEFKE